MSSLQLVHVQPAKDVPNKGIRQLIVNAEAADRIRNNFNPPLHVVVMVGSMGVGKSKFSSLSLQTFFGKAPKPPLPYFKSGAGTQGVTHGICMWSEPLRPPNGKGSVLLLDCEGMGDLDENIGANLYLISMLVSCSFAILLRPARIDNAQSTRLFHALTRAREMNRPDVLPHVFLVALETPKWTSMEVVKSQEGDDEVEYEEKEVSKDRWLRDIFVLNPTDNVAEEIGVPLRNRYKFIREQLRTIEAVKVSYLPNNLKAEADKRNLDLWTLLHRNTDQQYGPSYLSDLKAAVSSFVMTGGKKLPGSANLMMGPAEWVGLLSDLISQVNQSRVPHPEDISDRYLRDRFEQNVGKICILQFEKNLLECAEKIIASVSAVQTEEEAKVVDKKLIEKHQELQGETLITMVRRASTEIVYYEGSDDRDDETKLSALPLSEHPRIQIVELVMHTGS